MIKNKYGGPPTQVAIVKDNDTVFAQQFCDSDDLGS